ncbi:MAG: hypothetical protein IJ751_10230 [Oscillospiraceae bacterium]|nr:hypothetical protein [Oscillospiraceae bacterium]
MRKTLYLSALAAEAALCVGLSLARSALSGWLSDAVAFPLEPLGVLLRRMSLSGGVGNACAIILYVILGLLPCLALVPRLKKKALFWGDVLLPVLSAEVFFALYLMVNPGLMRPWLGMAGAPEGGKLLLGGAFYTLLVGYAVLRVLRRVQGEASGGLLRGLNLLLAAVNAVLVFAIFGSGFSGLLDSIAVLRAGNVGNEHLLGPSYLILALGWIVSSLPYGLDVLVVFRAHRLLREMAEDRYSEAAVAAADALAKTCVRNLTITVCAGLAYALLQLAFARQFSVIQTTVILPVLSILFVLLALLIARMLRDSREIKAENDLFI